MKEKTLRYPGHAERMRMLRDTGFFGEDPVAVGDAKGRSFAFSFLKGVFAEGIDAGEDAGLRLLIERAGLEAGPALAAIANGAWRVMAEDNRLAMVGEGLWGVPSLRFEETSTWGQDRLWLIEDAMIAAASA